MVACFLAGVVSSRNLSLEVADSSPSQPIDSSQFGLALRSPVCRMLSSITLNSSASHTLLVVSLASMLSSSQWVRRRMTLIVVVASVLTGCRSAATEVKIEDYETAEGQPETEETASLAEDAQDIGSVACEPACHGSAICIEGHCFLSMTAKSMVAFSPSDFLMGCQGDNCNQDDVPQHLVSLSGFKISSVEVTVGQYRECVELGLCPPPPIPDSTMSKKLCNYFHADRLDYPINCLTWQEADHFCGAMVSGGRLPTEAQWERCLRLPCDRAGCPVSTLHSWGNDEDPPLDAGNFADQSYSRAGWGGPTIAHDDGWAETSPVGLFAPVTPGVWDLEGNVWEMVRDNYEPTFYASLAASKLDPVLERDSASARVIRGGSYVLVPEPIAARFWVEPNERNTDLGFRCAVTQ